MFRIQSAATLLSLLALLLADAACKSEECDVRPVDKARFLTLALEGRFLNPRTAPLLGVDGDTISFTEAAAAVSVDTLALTYFADCQGRLAFSQLRPRVPADARLAASIDSLFALRPALRDSAVAQGERASGLPPIRSVPPEAERRRIDALRGTAEHRAYLKELLADDQHLRQGQDAALWAEHGYASAQADSFRTLFMARDRINFAKANYYVERYGYPDPNRVGVVAARAPWLVFHHTHYPAYQRTNFDSLSAAYRRGWIDDDQLTLYLGRAYRDRFGDRHEMPNPYTPQREVELLIKKLGWEEER